MGIREIIYLYIALDVSSDIKNNYFQQDKIKGFVNKLKSIIVWITFTTVVESIYMFTPTSDVFEFGPSAGSSFYLISLSLVVGSISFVTMTTVFIRTLIRTFAKDYDIFPKNNRFTTKMSFVFISLIILLLISGIFFLIWRQEDLLKIHQDKYPGRSETRASGKNFTYFCFALRELLLFSTLWIVVDKMKIVQRSPSKENIDDVKRTNSGAIGIILYVIISEVYFCFSTEEMVAALGQAAFPNYYIISYVATLVWIIGSCLAVGALLVVSYIVLQILEGMINLCCGCTTTDIIQNTVDPADYET